MARMHSTRFRGLEFVIPLLAIGKAEGAGKTKTGRPYIYNLKTTDRFMKAVKAHVQAELATHPAAADYPSDLPIAMELAFFLPRPKNVGAKEKWPSMCKPDNSNVRKAIEDAMTGVVYVNDKQIVDGSDKKRFCAEGDEPSIRILLWRAGQRNG